MAVFKDFIPAGEDLGGLGNGFVDFVPEPKPQFRPVPQEDVQSVETTEEVKPEPKKKK